MASQGTALKERAQAEGFTVSDAMPCLAAGDRGATLGRPALERRRAATSAGLIDRLSVHSPDRLARQ